MIYCKVTRCKNSVEIEKQHVVRNRVLKWHSCEKLYVVLSTIACRFVFLLVAIILSGSLLLTASAYHFWVFKCFRLEVAC